MTAASNHFFKINHIKLKCNDLRERVIKNYLYGITKEDIVNVSTIWIDTLNRWGIKYKKIGSIEPEKQEKFRWRKFSDIELIDAVNKKPSSILGEIAKIFSVSHQDIIDRLKLLGMTRKKKTFFVSREK